MTSSPAPGPSHAPPASCGAVPPPSLFVCVLCRLSADEEERSGRRLHDALVAAQQRAGTAAVRIVPAECLSNCNRACSVAFAGPDRWTYVYGGLAPDSAEAVLDGAVRYAATADGLVPWRERPDILRKGLIARIPPLATTQEP
ncbi:DUF1636 domain-containing protein [Rhodoplanes sp. TEM]|uniref:DUF1636 domain-containing protein n=1 Tax=Rhodoplanes tepidamans TaxID=200616 RepID=A0ABT5J990_RHOTP|nr:MULTISPECIES: DUF1636 domain-containing protein [Rhodoplanes]MDC7785869.1 DUF1636 domain-containing protein [Rhodoplanes tepidamans]MDC7984981.1 DUF1636 domain-containing protein [Rhodoplanes sp. TEM]MDQ0355514.1 putative metal-binding protein [Rhodoplanes tepidamans]